MGGTDQNGACRLAWAYSLIDVSRRTESSRGGNDGHVVIVHGPSYRSVGSSNLIRVVEAVDGKTGWVARVNANM